MEHLENIDRYPLLFWYAFRSRTRPIDRSIDRQTIADIGAGGGYFCLRFAEAVGREGKVYAADTNSGFLESIDRLYLFLNKEMEN